MSGDVHVRFCESLRGRFPRATRLTILVKSQRAGQRVLHSISQYLQNRLKLVINKTKSRVVKTSESKFLGFTFRRGRIQWHPKTLLKFKQQVRRLTNRNWGVSMKYQLFKTSQFIRGWINYFGETKERLRGQYQTKGSVPFSH